VFWLRGGRSHPKIDALRARRQKAPGHDGRVPGIVFNGSTSPTRTRPSGTGLMPCFMLDLPAVRSCSTVPPPTCTQTAPHNCSMKLKTDYRGLSNVERAAINRAVSIRSPLIVLCRAGQRADTSRARLRPRRDTHCSSTRTSSCRCSSQAVQLAKLDGNYGHSSQPKHPLYSR